MIKGHNQPERFIVEESIEDYEELLVDTLAAIKERPAENLGTEFREALQVFSMVAAGEEENDVVLKYLRLAKNIGVANFQFGSNPGSSFMINVLDNTFSLTGQDTSVYMDTDTWLDAFFCATMLRDMQATKILCSVPESVHLNANIKPDSLDLALVAVYKGLYDPDVNIAQLLVDAMEASNPENLPQDRRYYAINILEPQLMLIQHLLMNKEEEFNKELENAINDHKEFWAVKDRAESTKGWVSLPLLAACVIAVDNKSFNITVESDYIPEWLIQGNFER